MAHEVVEPDCVS
jgi:signal transduction histidine kinase